MHGAREAAYRLTRARRLTPENIGEAARFLPNLLIGPGSTEFDAVESCRRLLKSGSMIGILIDRLADSGGTGATQVIGVGAAAFVSRAFMQDEQLQPRPGLSERVLWSALTERPVALDRRSITADNMKDGLNVVIVLHHGEPPDDLEAEYRRHLVMRFMEDMRGYRLREILTDVAAEPETSGASELSSELSFVLAGGFRVRSDYAEHDATQMQVDAPRSLLVGITRAEALHDQSSLLSLLFQYEPPRMGFSVTQRKLLMQAMTHKTDTESAVALGLSLSAVKKTWSAIFERASVCLPEIESSDETGNSPESDHRRGPQKRHRLLSYLLDHPEELRP